jgi:enoyl-CoA hydratase/carnithine racemase
MAYSEILYDVSERIATLTLNRPEKLNAWTNQMGAEVRAALLAAEEDADVRIIIITGAGRGFCAGADMGMLQSAAASGVDRRILPPHEPARNSANPNFQNLAFQNPGFQRRYSYFPSIQKPILAAINGPCAGLGFVLALYCDLRFASDTARLGTAFARRGLIAEHGIAWMLPRLIGPAHALDLLLSARMIDAAEAARMGLVNRVIPAGQLLPQVRAYAAELGTMVSPRSMSVIKQQVYNALMETLEEATVAADQAMLESFESQDFKEGVAHFVEKRAPAFTGK